MMNRSLTVTARADNLADVRCFVRDAAVVLGADPEAVADVVLAADEVVTNVILHGYGNGEGTVRVDMERQGDDLIVRVRDQAPPFDPTGLPDPDLSVPFLDRPLGGLGVYLVRQVVDKMIYRAPAGGGNELTLVKRIG